MGGWEGGAAHGVVEGELGHEAWVWFGGGPALADLSEGGGGGEGGVLAEEVGD